MNISTFVLLGPGLNVQLSAGHVRLKQSSPNEAPLPRPIWAYALPQKSLLSSLRGERQISVSFGPRTQIATGEHMGRRIGSGKHEMFQFSLPSAISQTGHEVQGRK
jgi:hypothetical protein